MMYWSERQKQLYTQLEKDEKALTQRLTSYYRLEFGKLDKEIAAFYQKYGVNNIIEYRTVMEALPDSDRKLLIEQMEEFSKKYPEYAHLIPVRKNIYRLNRLEGLQQSVIMHQLNMGAVTKDALEKHLNKQVLRSVNAAAEAMGFGKNFYTISDDIVKRFVGVPWCNGKDFSERIWDNTNKLAYYLTTDISQGFARGDSYSKLTQQLKTRFTSVSTKDAYRLVYTEGTYVMAEGSMQPFTEDFEKYKISTAADGNVCSICSSLARKEFYIKDRAAGVNFPPFHPWCRCTFEIIVDDWDKWMDDYVNKHSADKHQAEKVLNNVTGDGIMNTIVDKKGEDVHYIGKLDKNIYKCVTEDIITDEVVITEKQIEHIKFRHPNDYERFGQYFNEIVSNPDYIIEANRPDSALVLKEIHLNNEQFKAVVRIATSRDNPNYKNSIITFMKIDDKEWKRLINNKKILYKSE